MGNFVCEPRLITYISYVDQLNQILHYLGTPSEDTLRRVGSPRAQDYIRSLPIKPRIPFQTLYPHANPLALDLLVKVDFILLYRFISY